MFDVAIIGGGPAGLTAALYALRANRSVVLFEGKALGGTLNDIEKIENYPAFNKISGVKLAQKMTAQVNKLKPVIVKQFVLSLMRDEHGFLLFTPSEEYKAKRVIFCTGVKRPPLRAAAAFEGDGVSYCAICDGFFYKNKTVAVVGDGYTAQEDVEFLSNICKKVYWVSKAHDENAKIYPNVEPIVGSLKEVLGEGKVERIVLKSGAVVECEALFVALGTSPESDLFAAVTDESASVGHGRLGKNAFIAGDAQGGFKQIVYACASAAFAATEIFKD